MEIVKQDKNCVTIRTRDGNEILIQDEGDSVVLSAMPPNVIKTKNTTSIYVQIGTERMSTQVCTKPSDNDITKAVNER